MRLLKIARGVSRFDKHWKNVDVAWDELANELSNSQETKETHEEYVNLKKDVQDNIKDIGGFVGGTIRDGIRRKENVIGRDLITLDLDEATVDFWDEFTAWNEFACCVYSTHKSTPSKPRLRLVAPLSRTCTPEEYEAVARRIGQYVGLKMLDRTTFQPSRLMYYPSHSKGATPIYYRQDGDWIDVDEVLATYRDWHDISEYPLCDGELKLETSTRKKAEDPTTKNGLIGVFCRTYDVPSAIETFIPEVYEKSGENRYTYTSASTSNGLVIYDGGLRAYSNHATDPAYGISLNAFDIVRIHRFGDLDKKAKEDTPVNKLPSYIAMSELISEDENVKTTLVSEKLTTLESDFSEVDAIATVSQTNHETIKSLQNVTDESLKFSEKDLEIVKGAIVPSINNFYVLLHIDPNLKNLGRYNEFSKDIEIGGKLPWRLDAKKGDPWRNRDDSQLRRYFEKKWHLRSKEALNDALESYFDDNSYHPIREYLDSLVWDGTPRLDNLLIDYMGVEDNAYTRTITRKTLVAAVARVYQPGRKFDYMLTLVGKQGTYKTTLIQKLGMQWFDNSIYTMQGGKDAYEQVQGVWLAEVAELAAFKKTDIENLKNFISKTSDKFRPAYAKRSEVFPRQCIMIGTTNERTFITDSTGGRRFWTVDVHEHEPKYSVASDLTQDIVDQVWAEAKVKYDAGESLFLPYDVAKMAEESQAAHTEDDTNRGVIMQYLDTLLPENWESLDLYQRRQFLHGSTDGLIDPQSGTVQRQRVCAREILEECLEMQRGRYSRTESARVNAIMRTIPGWVEEGKNSKHGKLYGVQRGFRREDADRKLYKTVDKMVANFDEDSSKTVDFDDF